MSKEKQIEEMRKDLIEIFDEEYEKRRLITPQNTAEKMTAKGYRNPSEVAREIFEEIEEALILSKCYGDSGVYFERDIETDIVELKKKYTEVK